MLTIAERNDTKSGGQMVKRQIYQVAGGKWTSARLKYRKATVCRNPHAAGTADTTFLATEGLRWDVVAWLGKPLAHHCVFITHHKQIVYDKDAGCQSGFPESGSPRRRAIVFCFSDPRLVKLKPLKQRLFRMSLAQPY
jgi:hypothetical protein